MTFEEPLSIGELEEAFMLRGIRGAKAIAAAQQKYYDLMRGINLPYELYIDGYLTVEGEIS